MLIETLGKTILDKTLVIVLAHPNDENKTNILNDCLKDISFPKLLSCNYPLSDESQRMCDWIIYSKENPILHDNDFGKYDIFLSRWFMNEHGEKIHKPHKFDNQFAVSYLIKNGLKFARNLNKEYIHVLNYDFDIEDDVIIENTIDLLDNNLVIYKTPVLAFGRPACSTAFFSGRLSTIEMFFNQFNNQDEYYWYKHDGLFLEEKLYSYAQNNIHNIKEKSLDDLGHRYHLARHAIVADFVYDE